MTFLDWVSDTKHRVQEEGSRGLKDSLYHLYLGLVRKTNPLFDSGTNVFDREWDLLVILDGCRCDVLAEVAGEYDFLDNPDSIRSVASTSRTWMDQTFDESRGGTMNRTAHVTANPHSEEHLDGSSFLTLEEAWTYGWDDEVGTTPADVVTDVAIEVGRETLGERDRFIVHYMQPHFPSVPDPIDAVDPSKPDPKGNAWKMYMRGEVSEERLWEAYLNNLRYVLDHVKVLLENVAAETVVISADHGNGKGEWGIYEHPHGMPIDVIREVPWYLTTAEDTNTHKPEVNRTEESTSRDEVNNRLQALGYKV